MILIIIPPFMHVIKYPLTDAHKLTVERSFNGHGDSLVRSVAWSAAGKYCCSVGNRKMVPFHPSKPSLKISFDSSKLLLSYQLVWDPYNMELIQSIEGLSAPAVSVSISDSEMHIALSSADKSIKIYHNITFELLQCITVPLVFRPDDTLTSALYVDSVDQSNSCLYTAGNKLSLWCIERIAFEAEGDGMDDICNVLYNKNFRLVVTVTKSGVVIAYNIEDGSISSKFSVAPNIKESGPPSSAGTEPLDVLANGKVYGHIYCMRTSCI